MATRIDPVIGNARLQELERLLRLAFDGNKAALCRRRRIRWKRRTP